MKLPIDIHHLDSRSKTILTGLFLSRFGHQALEKLGFDTYKSAYNVLGRIIGVKPERIRDVKHKFDTFYHDNDKKEQKRGGELPKALEEWMFEAESWKFAAFFNVITSIASSSSDDIQASFDKNNGNTPKGPGPNEGIGNILNASALSIKLNSIFEQIEDDWHKQEYEDIKKEKEIEEDDLFDDGYYEDYDGPFSIEGNIGNFIKAEKKYKDKYQEFLSSLHTSELPQDSSSEPSDEVLGGIERWFNREFNRNNVLFHEFINSAEEVLWIAHQILPYHPYYPDYYPYYVLHEFEVDPRRHNVASCICFHSFMTNLCEFIHLHRKPEKFQTGWMLVKKAEKHLGLSPKHYIWYGYRIYKLLRGNWILRLTSDFLKLLYRNVSYTPNTSTNPRDIMEACMPLAELAYYPCNISFPVSLSNGYKIDGKFDLPFGLNGYIGRWEKQNLIIIGFRGTEKTNLWNILTDFSQYYVGISYVYLMALGLLLELEEQNNNSRFLAIGHSLGGGLTQFTVAGSNKKNVIGFGYNSAGLSKLAKNILKKRFSDNIFHLHLRKDQIFLIGHQLGNYFDQNYIESNYGIAHELDTMMKNSSSHPFSYNEVRKILS